MIAEALFWLLVGPLGRLLQWVFRPLEPPAR